MAAVSNLIMDQGTTYSVSITVNDDTGTARNLTGFTARSQMRRSYYTSANTALTVTIADPTTGIISLTLTATQTANVKAGRYVYDLELVSANAVIVERVVEGIITVYPEVTK